MKQLGLQLYSINKFAKENGFEKTLDAVAKMGFTDVEFFTFGDVKKEDMKKYLADTGLKAISAHIGDICGNEEKYAEYMAYLGADNIVCPWADVSSEEALKNTIEKLSKTGEILNGLGFKFGFHSHAGEFSTMYNGKTAWDIIFDSIDPKFLQPQIDTANTLNGGEDVYELVEKYKHRMPTFHLKEAGADLSNVPAGDGIIDFARLLEMTEGLDMKYIYEYEGENPMEGCAKAAKYLLSL